MCVMAHPEAWSALASEHTTNRGEDMNIHRRGKNGKVRRPRAAYLPEFATMNPTAYAAWRPRADHTRL